MSDIKLTGKLQRVKDNVGNTLGSLKLEQDGSVRFFPYNGYVEIHENPLTVVIRGRRPAPEEKT